MGGRGPNAVFTPLQGFFLPLLCRFHGCNQPQEWAGCQWEHTRGKKSFFGLTEYTRKSRTRRRRPPPSNNPRPPLSRPRVFITPPPSVPPLLGPHPEKRGEATDCSVLILGPRVEKEKEARRKRKRLKRTKREKKERMRSSRFL